MNKIFYSLLIIVVLLGGCSAETPAAVPPQPVSATPEQSGQPTAYPLPADTATQPVAAYPEPQQPAAEQPVEPTAYPEMAATATPEEPEVVVRRLADEAVLAMQAKDMNALARLVHPSNGVRFSPYSFVKEEDLYFSPVELAGLMDNPNQYIWGAYDGSGEPINLSFADYFNEFIYDVDFVTAPQVSLNERLGQGNTIDNAAEFYPGSMIVEYHFPGFDEQYSGMDWRSLRLVFENYKGRWVLSGIIHDEWTT
jgi:hypothetical protein